MIVLLPDPQDIDDGGKLVAFYLGHNDVIAAIAMCRDGSVETRKLEAIRVVPPPPAAKSPPAVVAAGVDTIEELLARMAMSSLVPDAGVMMSRFFLDSALGFLGKADGYVSDQDAATWLAKSYPGQRVIPNTAAAVDPIKAAISDFNMAMQRATGIAHPIAAIELASIPADTVLGEGVAARTIGRVFVRRKS